MRLFGHDEIDEQMLYNTRFIHFEYDVLKK
jgi:hypothetical protein